jgi:succinate dehydrogenase hydrophobic anchor subunit
MYAPPAISERRAGAGPSDRNGQSHWLLGTREAVALIAMLCWHPRITLRTHRKRREVSATGVGPS